ncbi:aconitase X swivel domain-containing protein [Bosea sp. CER48]|jgi:predicted aconitase with swiveling domain|uniref:aconitase X swivel domain-containing protein n=1 Tax=Bosea sp. CER48 TaxID=3377035 RepID=UPI0037F8FE1D
MELKAQILLPGGPARGECLALTAPISFWGGVDPATGTIIDARHPQLGWCVAGTILALPGTIGSSSASAVLLELVHAGKAPAALLLDAPDAILLLGLVVAREMGWRTPPAFRLAATEQSLIAGRVISISAAGAIRPG